MLASLTVPPAPITPSTLYTLTVWWKLLVSASCSAAPQMTGVNSNDRLRKPSVKKHCFCDICLKLIFVTNKINIYLSIISIKHLLTPKLPIKVENKI